MEVQKMKPNYQNVHVISYVNLGEQGVVRCLGNPVAVKEPGRVWGVPYIHDIAKVSMLPGWAEVRLDAVSKDSQSFPISPTLWHWVNEPMKFMDRAPVDYVEQLSKMLKSEAESILAKEYNLRSLMGARADLAKRVTDTLNSYLGKREWGIEVDVLIPDLGYPSVDKDVVGMARIRTKTELPLLKRVKELEAEIAGMEAKKFAQQQEQIAQGYKILITTIMGARAEGMTRLAEAYKGVAESILRPYQDKLDPTTTAWILNGVFRDAITAGGEESQLKGIDEAVMGRIEAAFKGEAIDAIADKGGISPTLASILGTAENVIPAIIQGISSKSTPQQID